MAYHPGVGVVVWRLAPPHSYLCPFYWTQFDKILLTVQTISSIIILEHPFDIVIVIMRGTYKMLRENEEELLRIIRENDNPEQAVLTAIEVILGYLRQPESFEAQAAAYLRVPV